MSVLSAKDIQAFAKMINTGSSESNNKYSIPGTIVSINDPIELFTGDSEDSSASYEYTAQVQIDGGTTCTASYNGIICSEGDRVVVTIDNGSATITENYTNPNGNLIIAREKILDNGGEGYTFTSISGLDSMKYISVDNADVNLPEGYKISGLKSITIYHKPSAQSDYEVLRNEYIGSIHLTDWSFDGSTISFRYGYHGAAIGEGYAPSVDGTHKFKFKIIYSCVNSTQTTQ